MSEKDNIKAIVAISVEIVLMRIGGPEYRRVISHLERDHNMTITDCFEKPEELKETIKEVYEDTYHKVIEEIETEITDQASGKEIDDFLRRLKP